MRSKKPSIALAAIWVMVFGIPLMTGSRAVAQRAQEKVLHSFTDTGETGPAAGLISDAAGNLYGTTYHSRVGFGTVFELSPIGNGLWTKTTLHHFNQYDGYWPSSVLVFDSSGNLYGTTVGGGDSRHRVGGDGTAFELSPAVGGGRTETQMYSFNYIDGYAPSSGLILAAAGNLYGTTSSGGGNSPLYGGTVFELSSVEGGVWNEVVLRTFRSASAGEYGSSPSGALIFDAAGNLYGTTAGGGTEGGGTAFELSPQAGGGWAEAVIFNFGAANGSGPNSSLISDAAGNLYGTTLVGGTEGGGTVFELSPSASGSWTETVLYGFSNQNNRSLAGQALTFDAAGNLYGAIRGGSGNCSNGCGSIFKLSNSGGVWSETVLFEFDGEDGDNPNGNLIIDAAGNIYGTTTGDGTKGMGPCSRSCRSETIDWQTRQYDL